LVFLSCCWVFLNKALNIILATYSYYPYNHGGTEVYVAGLAAFLKERGHNVHIIAGMPPEAFNEKQLLFEDDLLRTVIYTHNDIPVTGVVLRDETTREIYLKFRPQWVASWLEVLKKMHTGSWDILHLHSHTSAMGEALAKACRAFSPSVKIIASYHVPLSCMKGTLLFGNHLQACGVKPTASICTACFISSRQHWPMSFSKAVAGMMPALKNNRLPANMRLKFFAKEFLLSFAALDELVSHWHVFSQQIKSILLLNGVPPEKIFLLQHGANPLFFREENNPAEERKHLKPTIFLFPSRFAAVKGFDTLLQAWCLLPEDQGRELWMTGEKQVPGIETDSWISEAYRRKDIKWLGEQTQEQLAAVMKTVHCTLIPSQWIEIGPLVFHEAIAAGAAVIASDIGGCRELAELYKQNSTTFRAGNAEELAKAISAFKYNNAAGKPLSSLLNYAQVLNQYK
jgi:glycosyltransferase involved in cell wall biosynthesis